MNAIGEGGWASFDHGGCFSLWEERAQKCQTPRIEEARVRRSKGLINTHAKQKKKQKRFWRVFWVFGMRDSVAKFSASFAICKIANAFWAVGGEIFVMSCVMAENQGLPLN